MRGLGASHVGTLLEPKNTELVHFHSSPPWVREMYREDVYPDQDPKRAHCLNNLTPCLSGKEFWTREPAIPVARQQFDEEIAKIGIRSSISVPVHLPTSRDWGYVSIHTDLCRADFDSFFEDRFSTIHLGAITAFNRIYRFIKEERTRRIGLTRRERECLLWLAKGLRNDRIADRLSIRQATVEFHLANARRKLDARTRGQAVVKAVQLGLIEP